MPGQRECLCRSRQLVQHSRWGAPQNLAYEHGRAMPHPARLHAVSPAACRAHQYEVESGASVGSGSVAPGSTTVQLVRHSYLQGKHKQVQVAANSGAICSAHGAAAAAHAGSAAIGTGFLSAAGTLSCSDGGGTGTVSHPGSGSGSGARVSAWCITHRVVSVGDTLKPGHSSGGGVPSATGRV